MASGLSKRVTAIESALALLGHFHDRLKYLQPTMWSLVASACALPQMEAVDYLQDCLDRMEAGTPFPEAWRAAVGDHPGALATEEAALLEKLGEVLGLTDLESQLSALSYTTRQLEFQLDAARADREKYHKLYGTLGVLAGVAIAIILV